MKSISVTEARSHLRTLLAEAEQDLGPIFLVSRSRVRGVLLSLSAYESLSRRAEQEVDKVYHQRMEALQALTALRERLPPMPTTIQEDLDALRSERS